MKSISTETIRVGMSVALLFGAAACPLSVAAQQSNEALAKIAQNPIASVISVPFQDNINFNVGPRDQTQNILNIQPVLPFDLGPGWNLITRTIVPVVSQPDFGTGQGQTNGLGDIQLSSFFSPKTPSVSGWIWGAGAIVQLPSATDEVLGQGKWALGPTAVALRIRKDSPWVYGALINNLWSVGGDSDRSFVKQMLLQPFLNYNVRSRPGLYFTISPIITANWQAPGRDVWTVPMGGGIGQIFRLGRVPANLQLAAYSNVERPDAGPDCQMRVQLQLLFPK